MTSQQDIFKIVEEQLKNNPQELKKLKKKMKKWSNSPEGHKNLQRMMNMMGQQKVEEEKELEPREVLRQKIRDMKNQRKRK